LITRNRPSTPTKTNEALQPTIDTSIEALQPALQPARQPTIYKIFARGHELAPKSSEATFHWNLLKSETLKAPYVALRTKASRSAGKNAPASRQAPAHSGHA
jgi:hypothetical protein